jgi:hypothetical protein
MTPTFEVWMREINRFMERVVGVSSDDLPDWSYWDAWSDGATPKDAARDALAAAGWNDEDEEEA